MVSSLGAHLDHIGIVVANIQVAATEYQTMLGASVLCETIFDPIQKVKIMFLALPDGTKIELIEPVGAESPVRRALEKGGGLNHLCFEVPNIQEALNEAVASQGLCVCAPTPAVAFGGRKVAFVFKKHIGLVEFVEASGDKLGLADISGVRET